MPLDQHDREICRCPRMGDLVPFQFCRGAGSPFCHLIINCWAARVDIGQYLADHFTPEAIQKGMQKPEGGRVGRMMEVIDQVKAKKENKDDR